MDCIIHRDDIEIIVSDNGSTDHIKEYAEIAELADPHVLYCHLEKNIQFYGNYNNVIKLSSGHYCLLISDEDSFDESVLNDLILLLEDLPQIGMMKTGTSVQYSGFKSGYAKAGYDAIREFFLSGNYISGTVYNREYVTNELIDGLRGLYEENEGYYYYPHLFVEGFVLNLADFYFYDKCLIIEGESEDDKLIESEASVLPFSSWRSRVIQLKGYLALIRDLGTDNDITILMFRIAVWKTIWLIGIVKDKYNESGISWKSVVSDSASAILELISNSDIPIVRDNVSEYLQAAAEMIEKGLV